MSKVNSKIAIDKRLRKINASDIWVRDKEFLNEVKFINKGLAATVLFKDVTIDMKTRKKAGDMFDNERVMDFTHMPFDDVSILSDLEYTDEKGEQQVLTNGVVTRYTRSKDVENIIYITLYVCLISSGEWVIVNIKAFDTTNGHFDVIAHSKQSRKHMESVRKVDGHVKEMANSLMTMMALLSFETVKVEHTLTFSERKHVASTYKDRYVEYTLDLSKPVKRRLTKSPHKGGTHASPCEHKRRGHYRTYKSGKVVRVGGTTVNKGSKSGVVEKDYSLGATETTLTV